MRRGDGQREAGRHRVVMALLLLHVPLLSMLGLRAAWSSAHLAVEIVAPLIGLWAVAKFARRQRIAAGAGSLGLMYGAAVLVHVTGGVTEAHFAFFAAFGLVALYRDWIVFFAAAAFAVGHHVVLALADGALFAQPYQLQNPLFWAGVHITFVTIVTAIQAVGMYDVARASAGKARLATAIAHAEERRVTALTLHDNVVQAIATANYALALGEAEVSSEALEQALDSSRDLVTALLAGSEIDAHVLMRREPALREQPVA